MTTKLPYLNVGCGFSFHEDWTNIDFVSTGEGVIAHNLLKGIPFPDSTFEVVYHSHVLEHFSQTDGKKFISECYRVLKNGGILRIAIPDLEKIINEYTRLLSKLKEKGKDAYLDASYDWILLELYDQTIRNQSGGNMVEYLKKEPIVNEDFILERCGYEVRSIITSLRESGKGNSGTSETKSGGILQRLKFLYATIKSFRHTYRDKLIRRVLGEEYYYYEIGKFRSSGEIHQWMYDEYSLKRLLNQVGFEKVRVGSAHDSQIHQWDKFGLETIDGNVRKPDSLFIEATK